MKQITKGGVIDSYNAGTWERWRTFTEESFYLLITEITKEKEYL